MNELEAVIVRRCEFVIFCAMCGLAFFTPMSSALVEWMFGIGLISFFIRRATMFKAKWRQESRNSSESSLISFWMHKIFLFGKCFRPIHHFLNAPLAMYVGIIFLTTATSYYPLASLEAFFSKLLQSVFTIVLMVEACNSKKRIKIFVSVFLSSIILNFINAFVQYSTGIGFLRGREITQGRLISSFHYANDYAAYLVVILPILFALSIMQWLKCRNTRDVYAEKGDQSGFFKSPLFMVGVLGLFLMAIYALGLTYSRAGWGAFVLASFFIIGKHKKIFIFFILGVFAFAIFFVPKMVKERKSNINGNIKQVLTLSSRDETWGNALTIIRDHAVLGVGLNNYSNISKSYNFRRPEYPHNCYLQMAAEIGLIGLSIFLWTIFRLFRRSWVLLPQIHDRFAYHLQLGTLGGIMGFLIHSAFDTFFYSTQLSSLLWMMMGLVLANFNAQLWQRRLPAEVELTEGSGH